MINTILPFAISLDSEKSNLYPDTNENQKFCYHVTGIGSEALCYEDLQHLTLCISDEIVKDIIAISATVDGMEQNALHHEEGIVQLDHRENDNGMSEYPGLQLNVSLDKMNGKMEFCFELNRSYTIGWNRVYLIGQNGVVNEACIFGPINQKSEEISVHMDQFSGKCCFTIIQPVCIEIPVEFSADAFVGKIHIALENEAARLEPEPEAEDEQQTEPEPEAEDEQQTEPELDFRIEPDGEYEQETAIELEPESQTEDEQQPEPEQYLEKEPEPQRPYNYKTLYKVMF